MQPPISSLAIANYFIKKASLESKELTPMQVLKLVYISHGWYLGLKNKPLISENVQAWEHGPVIPSVYHAVKYYGRGGVTGLVAEGYNTYPLPENAEVEAFLDKIWEIYKGFNGLQLSTLTHMHGSPWFQVYKEEGNRGKKNLVIPDDIIKEHYVRKSSGESVEAC